jgi:type I restriction enzyme M protein
MKSGAAVFENNFNHIDRATRNDGAPTPELDYAELTTWWLFASYIEIMKSERQDYAIIEGSDFVSIHDKKYLRRARNLPKKNKTDHIDRRTEGVVEVTFKKCLLFKNLKRLVLDTDPADIPLQYRHIAVVNPAVVRGALKRRSS